MEYSIYHNERDFYKVMVEDILSNIITTTHSFCEPDKSSSNYMYSSEHKEFCKSLLEISWKKSQLKNDIYTIFSEAQIPLKIDESQKVHHQSEMAEKRAKVSEIIDDFYTSFNIEHTLADTISGTKKTFWFFSKNKNQKLSSLEVFNEKITLFPRMDICKIISGRKKGDGFGEHLNEWSHDWGNINRVGEVYLNKNWFSLTFERYVCSLIVAAEASSFQRDVGKKNILKEIHLTNELILRENFKPSEIIEKINNDKKLGINYQPVLFSILERANNRK